MNRVVHFEMGVDDPDRAVAFYETVFGWTTQKADGPQAYWLMTTGSNDEPGINGGFMRRRDDMPPTFNTIQVASVAATVEKVAAEGGEVVLGPFVIPGVGRQAYCRDTEGNMFGVHEADPEAK